MTDKPTKSALAVEFTKRIEQMGISRSEFARASRISRQTLYNIEVLGWVSLRDTTYCLLDKHLHWPIGTARALATNEIESAPVSDGLTAQQRDNALRWEIAQHLNDCATDTLLRLLTMAEACKGDAEQPPPTTNNETTIIK